MKELKITKGECIADKTHVLSVNNNVIASVLDDSPDNVTEMDFKEAEANAELFAEAINVANECGKTPKQLLEQRDELLEALRLVIDVCDVKEKNRIFGGHDNHWTNKILKAINNCEPTLQG